MDYSIYFVATPIGNLDDITLRALKVLKNVDIIACEDTRESSKLLNYYNINKKLISYHKFNESKQSENIIKKAKSGITFAIITDQGMPGISDPGHILIKKCQKEDVKYTVLPGASSILTALISSGFDNNKFSYYGFVPKKTKERKILYDYLEEEEKTSILLETPHQLKKTLEEFKKFFPERKLCIARELTKLYEEIKIFHLDDIDIDQLTLKGEFVLLLNGVEKKEKTVEDFKDDIIDLYNNGTSTKDIVKKLKKQTGISKNEIYDYVLECTKNN
ncbi:MAG: 16S rRNA (cytidine(1402)-2'-O)-methyltransferase [Tissierellia bacterium]|nr:16S rRNA (cytidine(1402)-2'-O)-methyltransferase [Tissierellia bacterium]